AVELRLGEKSSSLAQDLVGPTEFTILSLELLDPLSLCRRRTRPLAQIPLGLPHPATERLARAADLCSNRLDGRPLRRILTLVLEHQPNRPLPHLGGVRLCRSHAPKLSRVGVSSKPGAIQGQPLLPPGKRPLREGLDRPDLEQARARLARDLRRRRDPDHGDSRPPAPPRPPGPY